VHFIQSIPAPGILRPKSLYSNPWLVLAILVFSFSCVALGFYWGHAFILLLASGLGLTLLVRASFLSQFYDAVINVNRFGGTVMLQPAKQSTDTDGYTRRLS